MSYSDNVTGLDRLLSGQTSRYRQDGSHRVALRPEEGNSRRGRVQEVFERRINVGLRLERENRSMYCNNILFVNICGSWIIYKGCCKKQVRPENRILDE